MFQQFDLCCCLPRTMLKLLYVVLRYHMQVSMVYVRVVGILAWLMFWLHMCILRANLIFVFVHCPWGCQFWQNRFCIRFFPSSAFHFFCFNLCCMCLVLFLVISLKCFASFLFILFLYFQDTLRFKVGTEDCSTSHLILTRSTIIVRIFLWIRPLCSSISLHIILVRV